MNNKFKELLIQLFIQYKLFILYIKHIYCIIIQYFPDFILNILITYFYNLKDITFKFYDKNTTEEIDIQIYKVYNFNKSNAGSSIYMKKDITSKFIWRYLNREFTCSDLKYWINNNVIVYYVTNENIIKHVYIDLNNEKAIHSNPNLNQPFLFDQIII